MPRELSRQEFDAIAARIAQSAPAGLNRQQFDDLVAAEAMKASGYEVPLTRERRAPGAPSALDAGHHPESLTSDRSGARERFGKRIPSINELGPDDYPSDAAFLKRAPEVGMTVGGTFGGPLGAGVGAGAGRLVKGQYDQGAHLPSTGEVAGAAGEGLATTLLGSGARLAQVAARVGGPAIANNARGISRAMRGAPGIGLGAGIATGNVPLAVASAATGLATHPRVIRGVGNLATRAGNSPIVEAGADWLGRGARALAPGADAFRQALLDALAEDSPASAVP
jgi:hypothetical protein